MHGFFVASCVPGGYSVPISPSSLLLPQGGQVQSQVHQNHSLGEKRQTHIISDNGTSL